MGKKVKNFIATVILCMGLVAVRPAHAWIWPTIDLTQISTFVSKITSSIGQVATATAQIQHYTESIHAIGDQVSAVAKYVTVLTNEIVKIISLVNHIMVSISYGIHTIDSILQDIEMQINGVESQQQEIANEVEEEIDEEINDEATEEDVQQTLEEGKQETIKRQEEALETIKQAEETVETIAKQADESLDQLTKAILKDEIMNKEVQDQLRQETSAVKKQINDFQIHAKETIGKIKTDFNEKNKQVIDAYTEYGKGISDYYDKKITREDLTIKGDKFKSSIASLNTSIDKETLNNLYSEANGVVDAIDTLKENMSNNIANNKEYSDEDENVKVIDKPIKKTNLIKSENQIKYMFGFYSENVRQYAKATIAKKLKTGYYGIDQDFLMSKELVCDSKAKVDDLLENPQSGMQWFKDCVIKAKIEKEYWCPNAKTEKEIAKCDPFKLSKGIYKEKYRNEGIYKHLYEDYSMANIVGLSKIKQYATTWQDLSNKKSTLSTLQEQYSKVDNTRNAYTLQSVVDIESPQLWSRLRRVDAIQRSKEVINYYRQQPTLFLDGRAGNEDYSKAQQDEPGTIEVEVGEDGAETEDKTIISHMFLHLCGLTADNISVSANEQSKTSEAEEKIKKCMYKFAHLATKGGNSEIDESSRGHDEVMREWRANEIKALTDSMFDTLYIATVNNIRSSKDYAKKLEDGEINIVSVQKGLKNAKEARDDYSSGAQINYYSARQLLTIVDADAQHLQTEIIKDIATMSHNFFDEKDGGEEE